MPEFTYTPQSTNDKSSLSEGWHPGYLVYIGDEETPAQWQMYAQSPRLWRWHFAIWPDQSDIGRSAPEHQTTPTSQKFSPGGKFQASRAYVYTCELLGRRIQPGERVNLDAALPLPCRLKITRHDKQGQPSEYANIVDLEKWPEGTQLLTPGLRNNLLLWWQQSQNGTEPAVQPQSPAAPAASQPASVTPAPASTAPRW